MFIHFSEKIKENIPTYIHEIFINIYPYLHTILSLLKLKCVSMYTLAQIYL